jgi:hypothetical protein
MEVNQKEYSIISMDILMGNIGGFLSLVFMLFGFCVEPYEDFRRDLSLV